MSYMNFMVHGLNGHQTDHLRSQFPQDMVVANQGRSEFDGDDRWCQDAIEKQACIDSVVQVSTVCDEVREAERSFWKGQKNKSMNVFSVTLIGGVAAAVAAIVATSVFPPILGVVVLTSIVSFKLFGISFFSFYRHTQAKNQYKEWKDPLPRLVEQRKQVGMQGFGYVYREKLRGKLVTNLEAEDLWHEDMKEIKMNFLGGVTGVDNVKAKKVRNFFEKGHLSREIQVYAFQDHIPQHLQSLSDQYQGLKTQYSEVRADTDHLKRSILTQKNERLRANDRQRDIQMAPWIQWFNTNYRIPLQRERDVLVMRTQGSGTVVMAGPSRVCRVSIGEYNGRLAQLETVFEAMTAPIRALHMRNEQMINQWAEDELRIIQQGEDHQLKMFFDPICQLVFQYRREENDYPRFPAPSAPEEEPLYPELNVEIAPSAPELEESYRPPAYNPDWNAIVGEVDWENGVLEITTTRRVYT